MKFPKFLLLVLLCGCTAPANKQVSSMFSAEGEEAEASQYDLPELEQNGELIAVTLSGPETYFEFRGQGFGVQYELIADFARSEGLRIRMETAHDTLEMLAMLENGEADVVALPLEEKDGYTLCAIQDTLKGKADEMASPTLLGWLTRSNSPLLAEALNRWYKPQLKVRFQENFRQLLAAHRRPAQHHPRPRIKNAGAGIISDYDHLFRQSAGICGWDWRLLAAQCYQESAFDPSAVSWAGAQGLMQLMPSTASHLGVQGNVFDPATNIQAAARLIRSLDSSLAEISDPDERISFILASYNGGIGHVRDAMALTKKYGGNPHRWSEVREYVLRLSDPTYYHDAVVKCGYLRGTETAGYVSAIRSHYATYRGVH